MLDTDLPIHPFTGVTALAVLDSGRIVWPVAGGADEGSRAGGDGTDGDGDDGNAEDGQASESGQSEGADKADEDKLLGPKGEKALAAEKEKRKEEARKRREAEAELERLRNGDDKAAAAAAEAEKAAIQRANARILRSEVKAAAAGKLADPTDALRLLDLDQFEVGEDGEVDEGEIADAISGLLKSKPYLAAGGKPRFQGDADQGARKKTKPPTLDEQIATAEKAGNWAEARRLKSAKLTQPASS
ncbi:hypothetical protein [Actinomadura rubrisoli]|uniref:Scaffolding protein n=1 Tax=Actinomadura rubrisoli TaxID=2530368 RepID=A0A4R5BSV6_9ACTN|nr:hypothetical protein [Actinomadura rubrisoli]TDD88360.1 hypothetical protein E1298_15230 [Actinomadura rubrisoli]